MSERGPSISIGSVGGDFVSGDKNETHIGNQVNVAGDMHGNVSQTQVNQINAAKEAFAELMVELAKHCVTPDFEGQRADWYATTEPLIPSQTVVEVEHQYHPAAFMASIDNLTIEPTPEEQDSLKQRLTTMFAKVGGVARSTLTTMGPIAVAALEAVASTPPYNVLCAVTKAAVQQFGAKE
jgi:hypothetical protein